MRTTRVTAPASWSGGGAGALAAAVFVGAAATLSGCGHKQGLRPHMLDSDYNAALEANFAPGMTSSEVRQRLAALGVSEKFQRWYMGVEYAGAGPQLLARVYEPGGMWIDRDDATIEWIDTWFVFAPSTCLDAKAGGLQRWYTKRGSQRYFEGEPIYAPPESETIGPTRRYPIPPPPPARPPERGVPGSDAEATS